MVSSKGGLLPATARGSLYLPAWWLLLSQQPQQQTAGASAVVTSPEFDMWAETYADDSLDMGWAAPEHAGELLLPFIRAGGLLDRPGRQLQGGGVAALKGLDAGCGSGLMERTWRERLGIHDVVGLDLSVKMLEQARFDRRPCKTCRTNSSDGDGAVYVLEQAAGVLPAAAAPQPGRGPRARGGAGVGGCGGGGRRVELRLQRLLQPEPSAYSHPTPVRYAILPLGCHCNSGVNSQYSTKHTSPTPVSGPPDGCAAKQLVFNYCSLDDIPGQ